MPKKMKRKVKRVGVKIIKKVPKKVVNSLQQTEADEDLRMILNKGDFNSYELDAYLNEWG